jgi:hypothetical protein
MTGQKITFPAGLTILGLIIFCFMVGKTITLVPFLPFLVVISISLFLYALLYTEQAMILLIIAMLLSPEFQVGAVSHRQNVIIRIDDLFIVVFMLAWLARSALSKKERFITKFPVNRFMLLYCITFILSTMKGMIAGDVVPLRGMFYAFKYLEYFMVFYLAAGVIKNKEQVIAYLKVFLIVFVIVNIYAITQIGQERVSAPFEGKEGEPNTLGGYQVLMLSVVLGVLLHYRSTIWKWMLMCIVPLTLVPFSYTESRASYAALVVMYLSLIFFCKGRKRNPLIAALIILLISAIFVMPPVIKNRILYTFIPQQDDTVQNITIGDVTLDPSASARINDYSRLFEAWKRQPFIGYGVTGGGFVDGQYISVLIESGVLGLTAFLLLLWQVYRQTLRIYKTTKDDFYQGLSVGFLAGTIGMVVHALTANTFILIRIMEPYWFLAAIVLMIPRLEKQNDTDIVKEEITSSPYIKNTDFFLKDGR